MTYPRLVGDNIPEQLKKAGHDPVLRKPKDDAEFYALLKAKLYRDLERFFAERDSVKRLALTCDITLIISEYAKALSGVLQEKGLNHEKIVMDRLAVTGGFTERYVVDGVVRDKETELRVIKEYGQSNNWPRMVISRNAEGLAYETLLGGEDGWGRALQAARTDDSFRRRLVDAVKRKENDGSNQ